MQSDEGPFPEVLVRRVREGYWLRWEGIHGLSHWLRVRQLGLRLAERSSADTRVVELFALFHDARRHNDGWDPEHGARGAVLVESLPLADLGLDAGQRSLLAFACTHHTAGFSEADVTVGTCWDADRLDLWRIGTSPVPHRLCTDAARDPEVIRWARGLSGEGR